MKDLNSQKYIFEEMPVGAAVRKLAFPAVVSQIILVIYNMADAYYVGLTDSDAMLTAVTICMPAFMFLSAIANLFGVGGSSAVSRALGRKDVKHANRASAFAFWGCFWLAIIYMLGVLTFRHGFINVLGGTHTDVHLYASGYMKYAVIIGAVPTCLASFFAHMVRSEGRSLQASFGIMLGGVLNMLLDPLFMFVILPRGNEATGAAIATMLSNIISLCYYVVIIGKYRGSSALSFSFTRECLGEGIPFEVISIGLPACLMTLCENVSYAVLDKLMSLKGLSMQAGVGIAKKVNMLAHSIARGISQGVLPLIAYNYAAKNYDRMKRTIIISEITEVSVAALCTVISLAFAPQLIGIFIDSGAASHGFGVTFLRILCIGGPFSACAYGFISFFQATGHATTSLMLALMRKGILDIPLMFILNSVMPMTGIVWATPIADMACCVTAIAFFIFFLRNIETE